MKRLIFLLLGSLAFSLSQAETFVYLQNNSTFDFAVSSQQTGTHSMDPGEWTGFTGNVSPWTINKEVLRTNRNSGVHNGDTFFFDIWLLANGDTLTLQVKLEGEFAGSHMWQSLQGPGFNHSWYDDQSFHEQTFSFGGKTITVKYAAYFTGGDDDILFAVQEHNPWPVPPSNDQTLDVLSYNLYMLTPPLAFSDQDERAAILPDHIGGHDVLILSEVFDNTARDNILVPGLLQHYPYKTAVVDAGGTSEDGGVMIMSKWPITASTFIVYDSCDGSDCLAAKGAMYAKIDKNGVPYHIFGTHTQAWQSGLMYRQAQLRQLRGFVNSLNIPADEAVLVGGDLNVDKILNNQNEYNAMFALLGAGEPKYEGHGFTYDPDLSYYASGSDYEYLDYVLHLKDHLLPLDSINQVNIYRSVHDDLWDYFDLSDHFAVWGHFEFPNTITQLEEEKTTLLHLELIPNPFYANSQVILELPTAAPVQIDLYQMNGKRVGELHNGPLEAGLHRIPLQVQGTLLTPGIYFYHALIQGEMLSGRVVKLGN